MALTQTSFEHTSTFLRKYLHEGAETPIMSFGVITGSKTVQEVLEKVSGGNIKVTTKHSNAAKDVTVILCQYLPSSENHKSSLKLASKGYGFKSFGFIFIVDPADKETYTDMADIIVDFKKNAIPVVMIEQRSPKVKPSEDYLKFVECFKPENKFYFEGSYIYSEHTMIKDVLGCAIGAAISDFTHLINQYSVEL